MDNAVQIVDSVIKYMYNTQYEKVFNTVYAREDDHESGFKDMYREYKIKEMRSDFFNWWGNLDDVHKERLVQASLKHASI